LQRKPKNYRLAAPVKLRERFLVPAQHQAEQVVVAEVVSLGHPQISPGSHWVFVAQTRKVPEL
jgi:hypothetical protein